MQNFSRRLLKSAGISFWFMILTFPVLALKINVAAKSVDLRWERSLALGLSIFVLALGWLWYFDDREQGQKQGQKQGRERGGGARGAIARALQAAGRRMDAITPGSALGRGLMLAAVAVFLLLPQISSIYQTTIFSAAFLYVMLALGLNIAVGIAGQLVLGYAAFYAIGAYVYGLLHHYFGLGFWICMPLGGLATTLAGLLLGFPVLRLRGDYLAIVTLGFGEITRLLLTNLSEFTGGSKGVSGIPRPGLFGVELSMEQSTIYVYYLAFFAALVTIVVVGRLKDSRVGLALQAMREDEIASEAMGIDLRKTKLAAFALGSCWAGFAGVLFAARNSYINPASFSFMESAMILSMVVLGGMGSIAGVVLAALLLALMPEYLRAFSEYRMLIFGALMVIMMIFRPQGMMPPRKRVYSPAGAAASAEAAESPASPGAATDSGEAGRGGAL